ncbi:hypothetical protein RDI58_019833 [Solanum bulbocastanum]|uniref:Uncharacterized protein n=1 Tax=Solanum bulbocastanum TaxID=147425 RepID=A0AAN8Y7B8_SOLBU
MPSYDNWFCQ